MNIQFSTEALIRAMHLPIDEVITNFQIEQQQKYHRKYQQRHMNGGEEEEDDDDERYSSFSSSLDDDNIYHYYWMTDVSQGDLAAIITKIVQPRIHQYSLQKYHQNHDLSSEQSVLVYEPTVRYIRKLLQRYARMIEQNQDVNSLYQIENDDLVQIMMEYQLRSKKIDFVDGRSSMRDDNLPYPLESCHVSYIVPEPYYCDNHDVDEHKNHDNNIIGIKIYPHHNDVGVRKVWEAGAALAEYLIENKHLVQGLNVCELGAGVGLTGLVVAGLCRTKSVHMTDYTNVILENLEYNCAINYDWVMRSRNCEQKYLDKYENRIITTGYLEWDDFISINQDEESKRNKECFTPTIKCIDTQNGKYISFLQSYNDSFSIAINADVLIAADVVYDRSVIPQLVQVVKTLLTTSMTTKSSTTATSPKEKIAIFATTFRNADTFALFENELKRCSNEIVCKYVDREDLDSIPLIFPCYFQQPRSHVRICIVSSVKNNKDKNNS